MKNENVNRKVIEGKEQNDNKVFNKVVKGEKLNNDDYTQFIEDMSLKIKEICNKLSLDKDSFNEEQVYENILEYVADDKRILYSQITSEIFSYYDNEQIVNPDQQVENMLANLTKLVCFSRDPNNKKKIQEKYSSKKYQDAIESMTKICIKMWDHVNLAYSQYSVLKQTDDEFKEKFNNRFDKSFKKSFKKSVAPETRKLQESMNSQLITLVGIFTALAFLVFGGITSLDNVFESTGVPVLKLMTIGSVWGLCILNMIFVFLYCVQRIIKVKVPQSDKEKNIFERYSIVFWCDFCIVSVMIVTLWMYYLKNGSGLAWLDVLLAKNPEWVVLIGSIIIIALIIFGLKKLIVITGVKTKEEENH